MWTRFTERARKVVFYSKEEAGKLNDCYVSTEHLLLGLLREPESVAGWIVSRIGIDSGAILHTLNRRLIQSGASNGGDIKLAPQGKRVIDLACEEARLLNNSYIGTEHLLLALIREKDGIAGRVLAELGADLKRTRLEVIKLQEARSSAPESTTVAANRASGT